MGLLGLVYVVLLIIGLLDCIKKETDTGKRIGWILVMLFIPYVGVALYYFIGRKK